MDLRFLTDVDWHGRDVVVLVDLRTRQHLPADEVARLDPSAQTPWEATVLTDQSRWQVTGSSCGQGDASVSVLTLAREDGWSAIVLADAEEPGRFAMDWCTDQLPYLADALRAGTGGSTEDRALAGCGRAKPVDWAAARAVAGLGVALSDPDGWIGRGDPDVTGWAPSSTWQDSREKLSLLVRWAALGASSLNVVRAFQRQEWDTDTVEALWRLGVEDFEEMAAMLAAARHEVSLSRVGPLLDGFHQRGFTREQVIDWCHGPLAQWFFNHPELAARYSEQGWTANALAEVCRTVTEQGGGRQENVEVLLWNRACQHLPIPVGLFVEAGVSRAEVAGMVAAARAAVPAGPVPDAASGDDWALRLAEQLEMLAGLRASGGPPGSVPDGVLMVEAARVPPGYPGD